MQSAVLQGRGEDLSGVRSSAGSPGVGSFRLREGQDRVSNSLRERHQQHNNHHRNQHNSTDDRDDHNPPNSTFR